MSTPIEAKPKSLTRNAAKRSGKGAKWNNAVSGADAARGSSGFEAGRVSAADLQIVSNGLWAAGAEAISINGQRLTTRSAIRFAGQAILVDFRPLVRPYVVTAIGDAKALQSSFGSSPTGSYLKSLEDNYGIPVAISGSASLTCPAGVPSALVSATARSRGYLRERFLDLPRGRAQRAGVRDGALPWLSPGALP